jgi:tetratricopeptide (TPR) repeat protein
LHRFPGCGNMDMKTFYLSAVFILFTFIGYSQGDSIPPAGANLNSGDINSTAAWEAFNRGQTKKSANKLDDAIAEFDKAISVNPDFYQAAIARGGTKFLKYDFQGALSDYDMAITIIEKLTQTYSTRSEIKNVLGDTQGSVAELDALNKLKPYLSEAYYRRGSVKKFLSNKDGSCIDFNKAMEMGYPKAETSMKQYCGYVATDGGGGAKGGTTVKTPKTTPQNTPAADTTQTAKPEEKK